MLIMITIQDMALVMAVVIIMVVKVCYRVDLCIVDDSGSNGT